MTHLAHLETPLAFVEARGTLFNELMLREQEVLDQMTRGCTKLEIAAELVIECGTVKNHVHNILQKLEVSNRHEAARVYQLHGQTYHQLMMATAV
jgi:DNA-binding NarL/FixJ family response regulator